jgi:hypothetical protein
VTKEHFTVTDADLRWPSKAVDHPRARPASQSRWLDWRREKRRTTRSDYDGSLFRDSRWTDVTEYEGDTAVCVICIVVVYSMLAMMSTL